MAVAAAAAVGVAVTASAFDLATRRVPNALTFGAAAAGFLYHTAVADHGSFFLPVAGCLTGFVLFFPMFALGGLGAGDVKLLAALGAWLGPETTLWVALSAAVAGGVMGVVVALAAGYLKTAISNLLRLLRTWVFVGVQPVHGMTLETSASPRLPYALPITAGLLFALWLR